MRKRRTFSVSRLRASAFFFLERVGKIRQGMIKYNRKNCSSLNNRLRQGFACLNNPCFLRSPQHPKTILLLGGAVAVLFAAILLGGLSLRGVRAFAVVVDGQRVALVDEERVAEEILADLSKEAGETSYLEKVTFDQVRAKRSELNDSARIGKILRDKLTFRVRAAVLQVDGETVALLKDPQVAEEALKQLKERFLPKGQNVTVENIEFKENVQVATREVEAVKLWDPGQVAEYLAQGKNVPQTYRVRAGDSLWTIARANNLTVEDLKSFNPNLKNDLLQINQELDLIKVEPLVHVEVAYHEVKEESIQPPVTYLNDATLWRGQENVKQGGKAGLKETEYQILAVNGLVMEKTKLKEKVVNEPTPKVVARGTRLMVASRGGGGSGRLGWPVSGSISSGYGWRGREFHTGLDISNRPGTPVYAAESGIVLSAVWEGNYGRILAIDHGDGLVTRYAHLSAFQVSVGAKVQKGDPVGLVGSTGRTTGPHLHFEVLVNGAMQNPINYLR